MISENIKKQALEIQDQERAELAHMLIDSLHPEKDYKSEEVWSEDLKKRIDRYEEGDSSIKNWSEVKIIAQSLLD